MARGYSTDASVSEGIGKGKERAIDIRERETWGRRKRDTVGRRSGQANGSPLSGWTSTVGFRALI